MIQPPDLIFGSATIVIAFLLGAFSILTAAFFLWIEMTRDEVAE